MHILGLLLDLGLERGGRDGREYQQVFGKSEISVRMLSVWRSEKEKPEIEEK